MKYLNKIRTQYWILAVLWTGLVYSTLYIVRPICQYLKKNTPFPQVMLVSSVAVLLFILFQFLKRRRRIGSYALFILVVVVYDYSLRLLQYPEEKLHYLEYGVLGYLLFNAFRLHCRTATAYFWAFLLTVIAGWGDEVIQYFLPNRYFQWEDVVLNMQAGALGLMMTYIFQRDLKPGNTDKLDSKKGL